MLHIFSFKKLTVCIISLIIVLTVSDFTSAAAEKEIRITILGTTDIHGRYMPWDYALDGPNTNGSLSQISTYVKQVQQENENTIVVDIGDLIQDNSSELFQDMEEHPAVQVLNHLNYDVWTVGNHEFDYGIPTLDKILAQFKGKALGGNVYKENGEQYYPSYTILEREGVKIGIIGITTPMVQEFKEDTDVFKGFELRNAKDETKKAIKELEGKVDLMVGVLHMGMENENNRPDTGVKDIANACPEFDVILSGHMHKLENSKVNGVLIMEPDKYATHVARVDLTVEKEDGNFKLKKIVGENIPMKDVPSDLQAEKILAQGHKIARNDANVVVGKLKKMDLVPENEIRGIPIHQIQQTPLTAFFGEVMLFYSNGADVTAHQIDNDTAALSIGDIKKKDIANCYQYAGGEVTVYKITGQDLKDYMEWSAAYFNQAKTGDVTISFDPERRNSKYSTHDIFAGVQYEFDLTRKVGKRVKNLRWSDNTPVAMDEELTIGMNAYRMKALVAEGGALEGKAFEQIYSTQDETAFGEVEGRIRNLAARYISKEKKGVIEGKLSQTWKITGVKETPNDVKELINAGVLDIGSTESGKSNIVSINIEKKPTKKEIDSIAALVNAPNTLFDKVKTNGELYQLANEYRRGDWDMDNCLPEQPPVINLPEQSGKDTYIVKKNDTLWRIARDHNMDLKDLIKKNHLSNPNLIYPWQKIYM